MADDDSKHERRLPECQEFNRFMRDEMRALGGDVKSLLTATERVGESTNGLWHEIRDEIKPDIKAIRDGQQAAIQAHADGCPAYQNFMAKAVKGSGASRVPAPYSEIQGASVEAVGFFNAIPLSKPLITLFVGLGLSCAVAIFVLWKAGVF